MKKPLISAIVPVYNTPENYLRVCIESLLSQSIKDSQIIIVDDGSHPDCAMVCDEFCNYDERVIVIHKENGGPSSARNVGLDNAFGKYITFVDSDDTLLPDAWERVINTFDLYEAECAIFGWITNDNGCCKKTVTDTFQVKKAEDVMCGIASDNFLYGGGFPWNKVWKADAIRRINNGRLPHFDTELFTYEDKYWVLQVLQEIDYVILIPETFYDYRYIEQSISKNASTWKNRQFNAYRAYDKICNMLKISKNKEAYHKALEFYFKFAFVDMRNMFPWRKTDLEWWEHTKWCVFKVSRQVRIGDLSRLELYIVWVFCLIVLGVYFAIYFLLKGRKS